MASHRGVPWSIRRLERALHFNPRPGRSGQRLAIYCGADSSSAQQQIPASLEVRATASTRLLADSAALVNAVPLAHGTACCTR